MGRRGHRPYVRQRLHLACSHCIGGPVSAFTLCAPTALVAQSAPSPCCFHCIGGSESAFTLCVLTTFAAETAPLPWVFPLPSRLRHCLCRAFPLHPRLRQRLCIVSQLPPWLRHCRDLVCSTAFATKLPCVLSLLPRRRQRLCIVSPRLPSRRRQRLLHCVFAASFAAKTPPFATCLSGFLRG